MIDHPAFPVEEWTVTETAFSPEVLAQSETIFTVANGYLGLRGNLDEPEPVHQPGTYLNGFYETRPVSFDQAPFSARVPASETMLNVTDGKVIHLEVNGCPLDIRTGTLVSHRRVLDMAGALLTRELVWRCPAGATVRLVSRRLASLADRHVAAISYTVEALDAPLDLEIVSSLVANESSQVREDDPREAAPLYGQVLLPQHTMATGTRLVAAHTTRASRLSLAAGAEHLVVAPHPAVPETFEQASNVGVRFSLALRPGERAELTKLLAYHWTATGALDDLVASVSDSLDRAAGIGFDGLADRQREIAASFWARSDIAIDGDPEVQQGVRFGLFQLLQAAAHAGERGIAAKGLTGQGYDGHRFWDSEIFLVPILSYTTPEWARGLIAFRHRTLDAARARAAELGLAGALFPWRTISGTDVSSYFPEGTAAFHLDADVAHAIGTYVTATGDEELLAHQGAEILVETARLWISLGHFDESRGGAFFIDEVTGPDEYSALADNNLYTNVMAAANLAQAAAVVGALASHRPDAHAALVAATGLDPAEPAAWQRAADAMFVPYDETRGIHPQDDGFLHHALFDLASVPEDNYPLLLHYHPLLLYGRQVVKQADLVLALRLAGERFTLEEKRRDFAYYEPITVHDSSLSAATHAVVAAELGDMGTAVGYLRAAALIDLDNLAHNVRDGVHLAGVASSWIAVVEGIAGFRHRDDVVSFAPRVPEGWRRVAFSVAVGPNRLEVELTPDATRYHLAEGDRLDLVHHGLAVTLDREQPRATLPAGGPP
ncbi:MAG: family 65 glycosyl hydrolase [Actinomycetota bacterium]|jgi:alpha,alpha-trehalose phosphorylase|nr:family 65 glycosyl hydrolase [Actinomycetota bacterium]